MNGSERADRNFWMVCGAALLFFGAFYTLLIPLPLALTAIGLPDSQVGMILAAFGVASLVGRPVAGLLGDRVGLRPVMVFGAASFVVGALGFSLTKQPWTLFGLRVLQALGYVAFTTATTALVAILAPPARRGALIALFGASANVAMTLTPASVNAALPLLGLRGAFWLASALAVLAALLGLLVQSPRRREPAARSGPPATLQALRPPPALLRPMLASLLLGFGFGAFLQFLPLLTERRALAVGWAYTAYGLGIIATRVATGRLIDGPGRGILLAFGFVALAGGLGAVAVAANLALLLAGTLLIAVGGGIVHPVLITIHSERARADAQAQSTASFYLAFDLGIGGGAWILGQVLERGGLASLYGLAAIGALAALVPAWSLIRLRQPVDMPEPVQA